MKKSWTNVFKHYVFRMKPLDDFDLHQSRGPWCPYPQLFLQNFPLQLYTTSKGTINLLVHGRA